jgi:hypothetical protein
MTHFQQPIKIVSGGQTGVDRAALDVALELGMDCGGWCPRGRLAEDGPLAEVYRLAETATPDYSVRTELNVIHSEGTLILSLGEPSGGTLFTIQCVEHHRKALFRTNLENPVPPGRFHEWIVEQGVRVLNVAGPRESHRPGFVYKSAKQILRFYLEALAQPQSGDPRGSANLG